MRSGKYCEEVTTMLCFFLGLVRKDLDSVIQMLLPLGKS